jgi:ATP-dependent Clp protease ATP-binding subunit ClpA
MSYNLWTSMSKEKKHLDRTQIEKNPDYYAVESKDEVAALVMEILEETIFGQPEACVEVAKPIARYICGLDDPSRPIYVGLFLGEPGVGKTEMGVAVSKVFDPRYPEERLKVIDCNMFQQSHDVQRILGAPPSYVGYGDEPLINKDFLAQPNVLVFDEIEKADTALHRLLLGIMDKAHLEINESEDDRIMFDEDFDSGTWFGLFQFCHHYDLQPRFRRNKEHSFW